MRKYKCGNCGYKGKHFVFQFTDYTYCVATNEEEPEFVSESPEWVLDKVAGDAEIGEPVGCPKCQAWGVGEFEMIN